MNNRGSAWAIYLEQARRILDERQHIPPDLRLPGLDDLAKALARALDDPAQLHGPRTLVLALRLLDARHAERDHSRKVQRARARHTAAQTAGRVRAASVNYHPPTVRSWAKANGIPCPPRGRYLPSDVVDAWRRAGHSHPDPTEPDA
jgi:hypothetical protein